MKIKITNIQFHPMQTCLGRPQPILTQNCGSVYPGQPYCVEGACTSEVDPSDMSCTSGFECTAAGYFPSI